MKVMRANRYLLKRASDARLWTGRNDNFCHLGKRAKLSTEDKYFLFCASSFFFHTFNSASSVRKSGRSDNLASRSGTWAANSLFSAMIDHLSCIRSCILLVLFQQTFQFLTMASLFEKHRVARSWRSLFSFCAAFNSSSSVINMRAVAIGGCPTPLTTSWNVSNMGKWGCCTHKHTSKDGRVSSSSTLSNSKMPVFQPQYQSL